MGHTTVLKKNNEKYFCYLQVIKTMVTKTEHFVPITQSSLNPSDSMWGCITRRWGRMLFSAVLCASSEQCYSFMSTSLCLFLSPERALRMLTIHSSIPKSVIGFSQSTAIFIQDLEGLLGSERFQKHFDYTLPLNSVSLKTKSLLSA